MSQCILRTARTIATALASLLAISALPQLTTSKQRFTRADTLRGTITPDRAWWDVVAYDVQVTPLFRDRSIQGRTSITVNVLQQATRMRVDLQQPLKVASIDWNGTAVETFTHEGNDLLIDLPEAPAAGTTGVLTIEYHGKPRAAANAPWDGGWVWVEDTDKNPWASVACQGTGASCWYPCKDHQSDEPERATLAITVKDPLCGIGNGRLIRKRSNGDGTTTWTWQVKNPINSYNLVPYIGRYAHLSDTLVDAFGRLDLDYWVLEADTAKARVQFEQVKPVLSCFQQWFGPYPFRNDGYKLVQSPYLGMEHQSAVAYGNGFKNGYRGDDLSGTGHGLLWDYIIVHETAHEWFGNSITTADIADMWVHEAFADYAETIYTECMSGPDAAQEYVIGLRKNILNDRPIIGPYGVNEEGSGDMYYKGANLLHMIRAIIGTDEGFKPVLHELCDRNARSVITSADVERIFNERSGRDLSKVFDQYLRAANIPTLEWKVKDDHVVYRWKDCVDGFTMPVNVMIDGVPAVWEATTQWQEAPEAATKRSVLVVDRNWYVNVEGPR